MGRSVEGDDVGDRSLVGLEGLEKGREGREEGVGECCGRMGEEARSG